MVKTGIGQDSHRFAAQGSVKKLVLGGVEIPDHPGLEGNSDADVVLHALTNAVSGVSGVNILGARSDELCLKQGVTDSAVYLREALATLAPYELTHVCVAVECSTPKLAPHIEAMKRSIARLCGLTAAGVGITATSGEGLTAFGRGEGIQSFVVVTAQGG